MKRLLFACLVLAALCSRAANPSYQNFVNGGFLSNSFNIYLSTGMTNDWIAKINTASNALINYTTGLTNALTRTNDTRHQFWSGPVHHTNYVEALQFAFISNSIPTVTVVTNGAGVGATAVLFRISNDNPNDHDFTVRLICGVTVVANRTVLNITYGTAMTFANWPIMTLVNSTTNSPPGLGSADLHVDQTQVSTTGFSVGCAATTALANTTNDLHFLIMGR